MKAIVYHKYGSPEVLELKEVEKPTPRANEVLIKIHATSLNSWDVDLVRGTPFIVRLAGGGLFKPIKKIIGCDVAGVVEQVGKDVKTFRPGDEVFGDLSRCGWGGFAEYVCAIEKALTIKPAGISFEQAAALPQAGVMALQGVRDYGTVQPGQKVLINGAGGGVGTFAIQLAKLFGAEVTGVDSAAKFEMMCSLGADHVIDYTKEDFTKNGKEYDLILDVIGHHSIFEYKSALAKTGMYRMIGGHMTLIFQSMALGPLISIVGDKKMGVLSHEPNKGLDFLLSLIGEGKMVPVIDSCYPLREVGDALRFLGEGGAKGKVVITIS